VRGRSIPRASTRPWLPGAGRAGSRPRVDYLGGVLCAVGLGGVVYGLIEQPRLGWTHWSVIGGLVGGAVCLVAFVAWEARARAPMLPLRLFRSRNFSATNI